MNSYKKNEMKDGIEDAIQLSKYTQAFKMQINSNTYLFTKFQREVHHESSNEFFLKFS